MFERDLIIHHEQDDVVRFPFCAGFIPPKAIERARRTIRVPGHSDMLFSLLLKVVNNVFKRLLLCSIPGWNVARYTCSGFVLADRASHRYSVRRGYSRNPEC